jgi:tRNA A37 threonylcarbamoyladenosine biosynthesis protein TsaE
MTALQLNDDQAVALAAIRSFRLDDAMDAFILQGSAGSGKTTLVATICDLAD